MAAYSFICEGCNHKFVTHMLMSEYKIPKTCNNCKKKNKIIRDYESDNLTVLQGACTIGSLAEKNTSTMSEDEKKHLKNKDKDNVIKKNLPEGMKRYNE